MFYKTWFLGYWDESIEEDNAYCHVFSERMAIDLIESDDQVWISSIGRMDRESILRYVYHSFDVIDDLVDQYDTFSKDTFRIYGDSGIINYCPIDKIRDSRLESIGI